MEFLTLLLIAAAVTTLFGLLIAGFIYVPWLVALVLIGLLYALTRVSLPKTESIDNFDQSDSSDWTAIDPTAIEMARKQQDLMERKLHQVTQSQPNAGSVSAELNAETEHHEPVLSYRGARYSM